MGTSQNEVLKPQVSLSVNGKSFYWASHFLSPQMGNNAAHLYAFCRVLDDMADETSLMDPSASSVFAQVCNRGMLLRIQL